MAYDHTKLYTNPESGASSTQTNAADKCSTFVWGSNNSHQLAEGDEDKLLIPKLTNSFSDVQQVSSSKPFTCNVNHSVLFIYLD